MAGKFLFKYQDYFFILLVWLAGCLAVYLPFWISPYKLQLVYQNWDGPNYVVIAKSLYNPEVISQFNFLGDWMKPIFFACNFPLYAFLIRLFSFIGYFRAMIMVSLFFSLMSIWLFYYWTKKNRLSENPLFLSIVFIFFPPRWFSLYHAGNSEPLFLFLTIAALYFFYQKKLLLTAFSVALAQLTRFQAIGYLFVFPVLVGCQIGFKTFAWIKKSLVFLLVPLALAMVFLLYLYQYGDFLAYFHSRDTISLFKLPPYSIFNFKASWVGSIWLEEVIFLFLLELFAISTLFRKGKKFIPLAVFGLLCFLPTVFVVQQDISRYSLWLAPILLIGLDKLIQRPEFKLILILVLIPATTAYTINFMSLNLSP